MDGVTEENRRILGYVSDLLDVDARESALLELSKKREQVPELALILWHSFGMRPTLSRHIS
jgi:CCR4-NOT transcription complex subunit 9